MPTPVAHIAAGLSSYVLINKDFKTSKRNSKILVLIFILLSILPDFDFLPGIFVHDINRYHHGISHSLIVAFLLSGVTAVCVSTIIPGINRLRIYFICLMVAISHPLLDFFSEDYSLPYGIPIFWPIIDDYYISSTSIFIKIEKNGSDLKSFVISLINRNNLKAIFFECIFALVLFLIVFGVKKCQKKDLI